MRREGRIRDKPTNNSRLTVKCRSRRQGYCRESPVRKSSQKSKGRCKRIAADKHVNPRLAEFFVEPLKALQEFPHCGMTDNMLPRQDEQWYPYHESEDAVQLGIIVVTINSIIEAAFSSMESCSYGGGWEVDERTDMVCAYELASLDFLAGGSSDCVVEAFDIQLETFESAVEAGRSRFSEKRTCSNESWSDVEVLETRQGSSVDDDWSLVDDEDE